MTDRIWFSDDPDWDPWAPLESYEVKGEQPPWLPFPVKSSRVRIALLKLVFPRREFVQIGKSIYVLRGI